MRTEHLRPLSDNEEDSNKFFEVAQSFAQAGILAVLRGGQVTALQKPNGGVRRIVVGDVVRRLVAKTMAKQFMTRFEAATKPFKYALATRAGSDSIAHAVQVVTDMDPRATVWSINGVGAFDLISRRAMMCAVQRMPDGETILPFVLQFYGHPSTHLWEDEEGVVHEIPQGEGGEQGDPLMPSLFALGQHQALEAIQEPLQTSETLMAFLDDVYVTTPPERTATVEQSVEVNLWSHARIQVNQGKTQVWNRCGERLPDCDLLFFRIDGTINDVWRGDTAPPTNRASLSLALLSVVQILLRLSWLRRRRSTESCWRGSQRCPISRVRGSCYCSVQHQEPVTFSELSIPNTVSSSPSATIQGYQAVP